MHSTYPQGCYMHKYNTVEHARKGKALNNSILSLWKSSLSPFPEADGVVASAGGKELAVGAEG